MINTQTAQDKVVVISLGEIHVSRDPEVILTCLGLGSCIAVCMYDPVSNVGGMAHVVLPSSDSGASNLGKATKYADVAIPHLLDKMREEGAKRANLIVKLAGGAQLLMPGINKNFNTGERNYEAIKCILADEALKVKASDIGGAKGRTVRLYVDTGRVLVKTIGSPDKDL